MELEKNESRRGNFFPDSSPSIFARTEISESKKQLASWGFNGLQKILTEQVLEPLWAEIFRITKTVIEDIPPGLSVLEKIQLPWRADTPYAHRAALMKEINSSDIFRQLSDSRSLSRNFDELLGREATLYPTSRFRANPSCQASRVVPKVDPGEGIFFDALFFHRSVVPPTFWPRYSLDIRYCSKGGREKNTRLDFGSCYGGFSRKVRIKEKKR